MGNPDTKSLFGRAAHVRMIPDEDCESCASRRSARENRNTAGLIGTRRSEKTRFCRNSRRTDIKGHTHSASVTLLLGHRRGFSRSRGGRAREGVREGRLAWRVGDMAALISGIQLEIARMNEPGGEQDQRGLLYRSILRFSVARSLTVGKVAPRIKRRPPDGDRRVLADRYLKGRPARG